MSEAIEPLLTWHWDPSRKCFYEGALADQRWCLPENIVKVIAEELSRRSSASLDECRAALAEALTHKKVWSPQFEKVVNERDEWKKAHEDLVYVRQADLGVLADKIGYLEAQVKAMGAVVEAAKKMHPVVHEGNECQMIMGVPGFCDLALALRKYAALSDKTGEGK